MVLQSSAFSCGQGDSGKAPGCPSQKKTALFKGEAIVVAFDVLLCESFGREQL